MTTKSNWQKKIEHFIKEKRWKKIESILFLSGDNDDGYSDNDTNNSSVVKKIRFTSMRCSPQQNELIAFENE